jgi:hypothetical protein
MAARSQGADIFHQQTRKNNVFSWQKMFDCILFSNFRILMWYDYTNQFYIPKHGTRSLLHYSYNLNFIISTSFQKSNSVKSFSSLTQYWNTDLQNRINLENICKHYLQATDKFKTF